MDIFSEILLMFIIFIIYVQGVLWLAVGGLIILCLLLKHLAVLAVSLGGIITLEIFQLQEYWFIVLFAAVVVVLISEYRGGEEEYYSSEMLDMLEEY